MIRIFTLLFSLIPFFAFAGDKTYTLIAPIGTLSGAVTLQTYLEGAFTTIIGIAGILAVLMLVICGIKLMGTGSVSAKSEAKQCIYNAIFGLLLALSSWIILNTINPMLLRSDAELAVYVPKAPTGAPAVGSTPSIAGAPTAPGCYFKFKDLKTKKTEYQRFDSTSDGTCLSCNEVRRNFQLYPEQYEILSECYEIKEGQTPTPPPGDTRGTLMDGVRCSGQPANLCEPYPLPGGCENTQCAQFFPMVRSAARGSATASFLMAMIVKESSCGMNLTSPAGACGPTQLLPSTANAYKAACGVTETITCQWLASKANWQKAICISANYFNSNTGSGCGSSVIGLAAGYNGGYGSKTCGPSANCASQTSCRGGTVRRWECPYEDNAHTQCNAGYRETRNYGPMVLYCQQYYQQKGL